MGSMLQWLGLAIAFVAGLVGAVAIAIEIGRRSADLFGILREPETPLDASRQAWLARLRSPDWAFYERHLGRPVPRALIELFANAGELAPDGRILGDEPVAELEPIDAAAVVQTIPELGSGIVPIARTLRGDFVYLRPGPDEPDVVYVLRHERGETEILSPSAEALLAEIRASIAATRALEARSRA